LRFAHKMRISYSRMEASSFPLRLYFYRPLFGRVQMELMKFWSDFGLKRRARRGDAGLHPGPSVSPITIGVPHDVPELRGA